MSTQVKEDYALLTSFLRQACFLDDRCDGVSGFWRRQDSLLAGEEHSRFEDGFLIVRLCFYDAFFVKLGDQRRHAMIAQASGMDIWRNEIVAQCMHLDERSHAHSIAKIIGI